MEYEVEEYSQDTRTFTVESNKKLPQEVVERIYYYKCGLNDKDVEVEHDITEDVYGVLKDEGYNIDHKNFKGLKVTTQFTGTEFGDDCQVDSSGDFFELENV
jgi:hypothetical protein